MKNISLAWVTRNYTVTSFCYDPQNFCFACNFFSDRLIMIAHFFKWRRGHGRGYRCYDNMKWKIIVRVLVRQLWRHMEFVICNIIFHNFLNLLARNLDMKSKVSPSLYYVNSVYFFQVRSHSEILQNSNGKSALN